LQQPLPYPIIDSAQFDSILKMKISEVVVVVPSTSPLNAHMPMLM